MSKHVLLTLGSAAFLALCAGGTVSAAEPGRTLGFAVTNFDFALNRDKANCPKGFAKTPIELYLDRVSPAERLRLKKPENLKELEKKAFYAPDGRDFCKVPDHPRSPQPSPVGRIVTGMALDGTADGSATEKTCAHEKFTAPDGTAVDNQMFRLLGCLSNYIGFGDGELGYLESLRNQGFRDGGTTVLFEVTGVDDPRNDDEVQIGVYNGSDPMALDAQGKMVPHASLSVMDDKKYHAVAKGKIVNGVIQSETFPKVDMRYDIGGGIRDYNITDVRIRLEPRGDGTATGILAGYLAQASELMVNATARSSGAEMVGYDCPTFAQAAAKYADGHKDPATGKCTGISTAWEMNLVSAFVIHPEQAQQSAAAGVAVPQTAEGK
jgi:hypothetical protein